MKITTAEAATSPPTAHAGADGRDQRRRECRPPPPPPTVRADASPVASTGSAGPTTVGATPAAAAPASATPAAATTAASAAVAAPAAAPIPAAAAPAVGATTHAPARDRITSSSASTSLAAGRLTGCLARQSPISNRRSPGRPPRFAGLLTSRYISAALVPEPNGPCPVHANTSTAPRLKMSLAGPRSWPSTCSGDRNPAGPKSSSGSPLAAAALQIPKSVSRGPCSVSRTFEGLRFRCTTPAAWMSPRPSASPAASPSPDASAGSRRCSRTHSPSDGPSTCAVASHGTSPSRSASTTGTTKAPLTFPAPATSDRKLARNQGSAASSPRMTRTSTLPPLAERARKTCPRPSRRSCPSSSYGPTVRASSDANGATSLIPHSPVTVTADKPS
jgi:hypothetical protein